MASKHTFLLSYLLSPLLYLAFSVSSLPAVEVLEITAENHQQIAPKGKEADWIFGDYVLRNDTLVAVIAKPIQSRNANMTVRNVAGSIIDLTFRYRSSDQLSCFYPGAAEIPIRYLRHKVEGNKATVSVSSDWREDLPKMQVDYVLQDGTSHLTITSKYSNPHQAPITFSLRDAVRADRGFKHRVDQGIYFCEDFHWRKAYGLAAEGYEIESSGDSLEKGRPVLEYVRDGKTEVTLEPGESFEFTRKLIPAESAMSVRSLAAGEASHLSVSVTDPKGFVPKATVRVTSGDTLIGEALTPPIGPLQLKLAPGDYTIEASGLGRGSVTTEHSLTATSSTVRVKLPEPGYFAGTVVDQGGHPIPAKVQFRAKKGDDPYFGADTESFGVRNVLYSANGSVQTALAPGEYEVIISRGPEYDADFQSISIEQGQTTSLQSKLLRSVDTEGWVSSDFHSHSSPSGDNTSDQLGRVLNLLAEHIEFAPCTEHNRIDSYSPHLVQLNAEKFMATCTGMELTGRPLPVNHQNAFPLHHHPHTQDGGGPTTHSNPVVQIERLAKWDADSEKLVQENHPLLEQIWADQDLDGEKDAGFERMFGFMDVIEVHPPADIFAKPGTKTGQYSNVIQSWLRMLNKGYRIPGVVNTDAHYNFHGSGWLRNYIKSSSDKPAEIETMEMVRQSERGHVVMTNGPFLEVTASSGEKTALPGDDLRAADKTVSLQVRVQCANWYDINRVQVFVNGRPSDDHNFTRRTTPEKFEKSGVVKFDQTIEVELSEDAHLIVATIGEGLSLGPVMGPDHESDVPVSLTNPIFVDIDGNGFQPNGDLLGIPFPYTRR